MSSNLTTGIRIKSSGTEITNAPRKINFRSIFNVIRDTVKAVVGLRVATTIVNGLVKISVPAVSVANPIIVEDEDPRNSDDRFPTHHHETHEAGGDDEIANITQSSVTGLTASLADVLEGNGFFGDGSDGDVIISINTTLTRDMFYNGLVVNNGIVLTTGGYRIFVKTTCTITGTIDHSGADGGSGGNATLTTPGSAGSAGGATASGYLVGGSNGVVGRSGRQNNDGLPGTNGTTIANALLPNTYAGGKGGNGGTNYGGATPYVGGTAGGAGTTTTISDKLDFIAGIIARFFTATGVLTPNIGGVNGGGGGGASGKLESVSNYGAGGGSGASGSNGGMIVLIAYTIAGAGSIISDGGNGGGGGTGGTGGMLPDHGKGAGGGGGGGGAAGGTGGGIFIISVSMTGFTGTISANGGDGGNAGDGGIGGLGTHTESFNDNGGGDGGEGADGGDGGSGGIIIIYTNLPTTFSASVNNGDGGNGGNGGDGGLATGYVDGDPVYRPNGNGNNGGDGGDGFAGGIKGTGGISPPTSLITYCTHGQDGSDGLNGTSNGLTGTYKLAQI